MELRERIGLAIANSHPTGPKIEWDNIGDESKEMLRRYADTAIAAMREWLAEVTPEMTDASYAYERKIYGDVMPGLKHSAIYGTMLAAKFGDSNG